MDILQDRKFSDDPELFKTMDQIKASLSETHQFFQCKGQLKLYRIDDIIFTLFPALQTHKRRAANTREIFLNNDPFKKDPRFTMTDHNKLGLGAQRSGELAEKSAMHITASVADQSIGSDEEDRNDRKAFQATGGYGISALKSPGPEQSTNPGLMMIKSAGRWDASPENEIREGEKTNMSAVGSAFPGEKSIDRPAGKSYGIPTIALLNPTLYKEMVKKERQMKDPVFESLKNVKERHTYQENRQQRIDKRNAEIAKELKERQDERVRLEKLKMLGKA